MPQSLTLPGNGHPAAPHGARRSAARHRAVARLLLLTVLTMLGTVLWAPAASAHDELLDLQPGNKVTVTTAPTQVQLVFSAPALKLGTVMRVADPTGKVVSTGPVSIDNGTVTQPLVGGLVDGQYRVDWRVTAADGHPVSGTYTFALRAAATPSASATSGAATSAPNPPSSTSPSASVAGGSGGSTSSGSGSTLGVLAGSAVAAAAVAGIAFALLRRRNDASVSNEGNPQK